MSLPKIRIRGLKKAFGDKKVLDGIDLDVMQGTGMVVIGGSGTGKSVLAAYLAKYLKNFDKTKDLNVALVVPMTSLRSTLKKVFASVKDLNSKMVIGPNEVVGNNYDLLIVDEAHRLRRRVRSEHFRFTHAPGSHGSAH